MEERLVERIQRRLMHTAPGMRPAVSLPEFAELEKRVRELRATHFGCGHVCVSEHFAAGEKHAADCLGNLAGAAGGSRRR